MRHTFVLVHGAWHGGWCWRRVADRLRAAEHVVHTPTLTGLGDRSHLIAPAVGLTTHITDIVNAIAWEELGNIVLCGHSYGGMVIAGVAERSFEKIRSIVFLDAFLPSDGDATIDLVPAAGQRSMREHLDAGETVLQPRSAEAFGVNEADRAWVDRLCVPQPAAAMAEKIALTGAYERVPRKTYIRARGYPNAAFDAFYARVREEGSWRAEEVACGHDVMVDAPDWLAERLIAAAGEE
jgi:pimeloyl-ACP methyl ester carboxylesterase